MINQSGIEIEDGLASSGCTDGVVRGFRALLEALPFEVWIRDREQRCIWANAACEAHWPDLVGHVPDDTRITEAERDLWRGNNARVMAGQIVRGEVRYFHSGRERTYINIIVPIREATKVCGTVGVNIDVTEARDAEHEVVQLQTSLVQADRLASLGALAAGVGHEIRNPITYVIANLRSALDLVGSGDASALRERLGVALEGAEHISTLLRDMLSLSARRELDLEPVDVHEVVDSIVGLTHADVARRVTLVRDEQDVPPARGNAVRLAQVLLNLVMNAVQACADAGGDRHIWIRSHHQGDEVLLSVSDDGPGIPPDLRGRIFDPFVTTKGTSTGLGLYVSKVMMAQMSGRIDVHEREGGGTEAVLALPISRDA